MNNFNFDKVKSGAPVSTIAGNEVRILCVDAKDAYSVHAPIVALVKDDSGNETLGRYSIDGKLLYPERVSYASTDARDLKMRTTKLEGFVNIIRGSEYDRFAGRIYATAEEAEAARDEKWIATVPVSWEE